MDKYPSSGILGRSRGIRAPREKAPNPPHGSFLPNSVCHPSVSTERPMMPDGRKGENMNEKRATRHVLQHRRVNGRQTKESIAEYERATQIAGWMFGLSFGLMFFVGLM